MDWQSGLGSAVWFFYTWLILVSLLFTNSQLVGGLKLAGLGWPQLGWLG